MCLYSENKTPRDLTGIVAYKSYNVINGTLVTPIMKTCVDSLIQIAEGPKVIAHHRDGGYDISRGYVHATIDLRTAPKFFDIVIKGRMVGKGYTNKEDGEVCAEGFMMEEIVYERGDEDVFIY